MGNRIAVLNEGQLQQVGTQEQVYNSSANLLVASFLGSTRMNPLKCAYNADRDALISREGGWSLQAAEEIRAHAQTDSDLGNLILGIRPEDVQLSHQTGDGDLVGERAPDSDGRSRDA